MHILGAFVKGSHKSSMQALKHALASERWGAGPSQTAGSAGPSCEHSSMGSDVLRVHHSLTNSCCKVPGLGEDGFCAGFTGWIMAGNPFRQQGRAVGGEGFGRCACCNVSLWGFTWQLDLVPLLVVQHLTQCANTSAITLTSTWCIAATAGRSVLDSAGSKATPVPPAAPSASDPNSIRTASVDLRAVSGSCYSVLQWLANYAALMTALPAQQQLLWGGMTELFDNYMLACFVLFSGVSLQTLVWHDDCLPNRLRSALLRITTSSNCKYKAEVCCRKRMLSGVGRAVQPWSKADASRLSDPAVALGSGATHPLGHASTVLSKELWWCLLSNHTTLQDCSIFGPSSW